MKIGLMAAVTDAPDATLDDLINDAVKAEAEGFASLWMANIFGLDAISTLAMIGRETKTLQLGTAVTPTYPRHPTALAQQALTTAVACQNRFNLGIGLSHQVVIESMFGLSYDKPARHMREYLSVLMPLLAGETVQFSGTQYQVNQVKLTLPGQPRVPTLVAALGPLMLKIAGAMADGTITWMTGERTLDSHIIPHISASAEEAGRGAPRIVAGFPIVVTKAAEETRAAIDASLAIYGTLPSYRAMLDKEGLNGPGDLALVGDEGEVRNQLDRLRAIGVTDFTAAIAATNPEDGLRTREFLASEC
ncbi:MAG: LLM class F420-dependent oxidoreductase [Gammaproteobacteria bacterium TMED182]|nr:LLM class F420-dependent oxidoreductase [Gammaproteobacteria bacterium]RPG47856.1 MAG: LLM class F420-dependent oxidoreductase [Gammaproteobacteria bacterium TMED182]